MIKTLSDFITQFNLIKSKGWIKTNRSGPTGIGKTLEDLLGIPENNLGEPDFGEYELKATRLESNSMLTIFTKSPQPPKSNTQLRLKFGYVSDAYDNDGIVLHSTLSAKSFVKIANTGHKLKIHCSKDRITIESEFGLENVYWDREALRKTFDRKYKNKFVYVKAESRGSGINEEFRFIEAYEVSGFDYDSFLTLLDEGKIYVDLRIGQYPDGRTHDHGTGFRIRETDQYLLFKVKKKIA